MKWFKWIGKQSEFRVGFVFTLMLLLLLRVACDKPDPSAITISPPSEKEGKQNKEEPPDHPYVPEPSGNEEEEDLTDPKLIPDSTVKTNDIPAELSGKQRYYRVDYVLDGDSIRLDNEQELRLIGIDAPEEDHQYAERARKVLQNVFPEGSIIGVNFDTQKIDRYERVLGYVYAESQEQSNGPSVPVNVTLVRNGFARVYLNKPNLNWKRYLIKSQQQAIRAKRNLFKTISTEQEPFYGVKSAHRYHDRSCKYLDPVPESQLIKYETRREALMHGRSPGHSCLLDTANGDDDSTDQ